MGGGKKRAYVRSFLRKDKSSAEAVPRGKRGGSMLARKHSSSRAVVPHASEQVLMSPKLSRSELKNLNPKTLRILGLNDDKEELLKIQRQMDELDDSPLPQMSTLEMDENGRVQLRGVQNRNVNKIGPTNRRWVHVLESAFYECEKDLLYTHPKTNMDISLDEMIEQAVRNEVQTQYVQEFVRNRMYECIKLSHYYD